MNSTLTTTSSIPSPSVEIQQQAAEWFAVLTSGTTTEHERAEWQRWRAQNPAHEQAWQQIEAVTQKFSSAGFSSALGMKILGQPVSRSRRNTIKQLMALIAVGAGGVTAYRQFPALRAEYQTAIGEQREWILVDGSRLTLNSNSAVDIKFDNSQRLIILQRGEILIETAQELNRVYRPLIAETMHGKITALGTRFNVYQFAEKTRVNLYEGQVDIHTSDNHQLRLDAGQSVEFTSSIINPPAFDTAAAPYWISKVLIADNMPLVDFIAEIARYRRGYLRVDEALAGLRISGAFPLADIDAILKSLVLTLPIEIHRVTPYWVTLKPAIKK